MPLRGFIGSPPRDCTVPTRPWQGDFLTFASGFFHMAWHHVALNCLTLRKTWKDWGRCGWYMLIPSSTSTVFDYWPTPTSSPISWTELGLSITVTSTLWRGTGSNCCAWKCLIFWLSLMVTWGPHQEYFQSYHPQDFWVGKVGWRFSIWVSGGSIPTQGLLDDSDAALFQK